jgi:hypothetical protein
MKRTLAIVKAKYRARKGVGGIRESGSTMQRSYVGTTARPTSLDSVVAKGAGPASTTPETEVKTLVREMGIRSRSTSQVRCGVHMHCRTFGCSAAGTHLDEA